MNFDTMNKDINRINTVPIYKEKDELGKFGKTVRLSEVKIHQLGRLVYIQADDITMI